MGDERAAEMVAVRAASSSDGSALPLVRRGVVGGAPNWVPSAPLLTMTISGSCGTFGVAGSVAFERFVFLRGGRALSPLVPRAAKPSLGIILLMGVPQPPLGQDRGMNRKRDPERAPPWRTSSSCPRRRQAPPVAGRHLAIGPRSAMGSRSSCATFGRCGILARKPSSSVRSARTSPGLHCATDRSGLRHRRL